MPEDDADIQSNRRYRPKRIATAQKTDAVLRVLRGEPVEGVSSQLGVSVGRVERWQNEFVSAGTEAFVKRKDLPSQNWFRRQTGSLLQWFWLLLVLVGVIVLFTFLQHRSGG